MKLLSFRRFKVNQTDTRNRRGQTSKVVNPDLVAKALAKAVRTGDIVNFRFLFLPFSPARQDSPERFETEKYAYLLPDAEMERDGRYLELLQRVRRDDLWRHINRELNEQRPAQLPAELLLMLADNAVRLGKYNSAAQAYELLRIRARMQDEFYEAADRALDAGDIPRAVRGYLVATGLAYDYAAFPEPLPKVPDFQTRALALHGDYPTKPEDFIALQPIDAFLRIALGYMLLSPEAAARLDTRPVDMRAAFLQELIHRCDPAWTEFAARFREAYAMSHELATRLASNQTGDGTDKGLADELAAAMRDDALRITAHLLGRVIPEGEWWQYLKELAYEHPAAALFVCRHIVGDVEVLMPLYAKDSPIALALELTRATN